MKIERVNSELKKQIAYVIDGELKDPRLDGMITITNVNTTADLKYAKVYLSFFTEDEAKKNEAYEIICNAAGFIRSKVKSTVKLRYMPELHFVIDNSLEYGMKIDKILKTLGTSSSNSDNGESL